jgi:chromosome partitioning protein
VTVIAIVNRKGGSGKSTLATHVAAWLARGGTRAMLGDVDRQQSVVHWLRRREKAAPPGEPLVGWAVDARNVLRPPAGVAHVVLDTPGGLHGFEMARLLVHADIVLMPVCDGVFDRESAAACLAEMRTHPRVAGGRVQVAVVGMRVDARTHGEDDLRAWAAAHEVPFVGALRDARVYVRAAEAGLSVFDLPPVKVAADLAQWQPVVDWLAQALAKAEAARIADARTAPASAATGVPTAPTSGFKPSRPIIDRRDTHRPLPARPATPPATSYAPADGPEPPAGWRGMLQRMRGWVAPQPVLARSRPEA